MNKTYLISDTHFGHKKMIEYCGRPNDFEEIIWNNLDKINDYENTLIHLGDFCIGQDEHFHSMFETYKFKKILVLGNHDNKSNSWYLNKGWDFVCENFVNKYFGKKIMFSHTPLKLYNNEDLNIHGHFHNNLPRLLRNEYVTGEEEYRNKHDIENLTDKHKLISIENLLSPINLKQFIS